AGGSPLYYTDARAKLRLTKPSRRRLQRAKRLRKSGVLAHPSLNIGLHQFGLLRPVCLRKERQHVANPFSSTPVDVIRANLEHGLGSGGIPNRVRKSSWK